MRDIKPGPLKPTSSPMEPAPDSLPKPKKPLPGRAVPLTTIKIPKEPTSFETNQQNISSPLRKPSFHIGKREKIIFIIILFIVVVVAALFILIFLPRANVQLILRTMPLQVDQQFDLSSANKPSQLSIPSAAFFRELDVSGSSPVTSTAIDGKKSTGTVQLINKSFDPQRIRDKSRLVTADDKLYFMQKSVTIPASSSTGVASISVPIEAAQAGAEFNIGAGQRLDFVTLEDNARQLIYAQVIGELSGGSGDEVLIVQEPDIDAAKTHAGQTARQKVESEIKSELPQGWELFSESWMYELAKFVPAIEIGDKTDNINYTARVTVRVFGYDPNSLAENLKKSLIEGIGPDQQLFPSPVKFEKEISETDWNKGSALVTAHVDHATIPILSIDTVRQNLVSKSHDEAITYLESLSGVRSATIQIKPFWAKSMPRIQKRIELDIHPEREI